MSAYVDACLARVATPSWRHGPSCHLFADTLDELHEAARRLGLRREWFQGKTAFAHYDLTAKRRAEAVRLGIAREVSRDFVVGFLRGCRFYADRTGLGLE